jgi:hypothetical protein
VIVNCWTLGASSASILTDEVLARWLGRYRSFGVALSHQYLNVTIKGRAQAGDSFSSDWQGKAQGASHTYNGVLVDLTLLHCHILKRCVSCPRRQRYAGLRLIVVL